MNAATATPHWRALLRPGDVLTLGAALALCVFSAFAFWRGAHADGVEIRARGQVVARLPLNAPRTLAVDGALGKTVVEIAPGQARIAADPGPRQYCVRQGWLRQAGAVAICAPSEVSIRLTGSRADHDSLAY